MASSRSLPVLILGWLWIVLGCAGLLTGTVLIMAIFFLPMPSEVAAFWSALPAYLDGMDTFAPALSFLSRYGWALALGHLGFSFFGLLGGIGLLGRRSWARAGLEGLCWIYLITCVAGAALWVQLQRSLHELIRTNVDIAEMQMAIIGATDGMLLSGVTAFGGMGLLVGLLIWALRSSAVRQAMKS